MMATLFRASRRLALAALPLLLAGCATLTPEHEPKVEVVGVEPLPGESLEMRMAVKLRIVNPSKVAIDYDGVYLEMDMRGKHFASGVSNVQGSVPRFGEVVLTVPMTVTATAIWQQALIASEDDSASATYRLRGKLSGRLFHSHSFESEGEFQFPIVVPGHGGAPWQ